MFEDIMPEITDRAYVVSLVQRAIAKLTMLTETLPEDYAEEIDDVIEDLETATAILEEM